MKIRFLMIFSFVALSLFCALPSFSSERVPGDFLVVFKTNEMMASFGGKVPDAVLNSMLDFQAEYLKHRYNLEVSGTYPEVTRSNGKGMFHVHSKAAARSEQAFDETIKKLKDDPSIESVSENRSMKLFKTN